MPSHRKRRLPTGTERTCGRCPDTFPAKQGQRFCTKCTKVKNKPDALSDVESAQLARWYAASRTPMSVELIAATLGSTRQFAEILLSRAMRRFRRQWAEMFRGDCPFLDTEHSSENRRGSRRARIA